MMKSITREIIDAKTRLRDYDRDLIETLAAAKDDLSDPIVLMQLALIRNAQQSGRRLLRELEAEWFTRQWEPPR